MCPAEEIFSAFVQGTLAPEERTAVEVHLDRCSACRTVLSAMLGAMSLATRTSHGGASTGEVDVAAQLANAPDTSTSDRYVIERQLGSGAMGIVYAAHDAQLDRRVALKVLRFARRSDDRAAARLLREARSLAKLAHPNVVTVYDAGTLGGDMFIAMELVEGSTLSRWLAAERRTVKEILDCFESAGRGLAAAHAAGLVHRDFKPDNVLIGADGRVRVTDFGLARVTQSQSGSQDSSGGGAEPVATPSPHDRVTRQGAVVGTPAYLAPEHAQQQLIDARGDQFSFCVALFEALFGTLPFAVATVEERARAAREGKIAWPADKRGVPARVLAALQRGLDGSPDRRFGTMDALLEELRLGRHPVRRPLAWALGGVAVLALAVLGATLLRQRERVASCRAGAERTATAWSAAHRAQLLGQGAQPLVDALEGYAARWRAEFELSCELAEVRQAGTEETWRGQRECLDARLDELAQAVVLLLDTTSASAERAAAGVSRLTAPTSCRGGALGRAEPRLVRGRALFAASRLTEAEAQAQAAVGGASADGRRAAHAAALILLGEIRRVRGDGTEAADAFFSAVAVALAAGEPHLAAQGWLSLAEQARAGGRDVEAARWLEQAKALVVRGEEDPELSRRVAAQAHR